MAPKRSLRRKRARPGSDVAVEWAAANEPAALPEFDLDAEMPFMLEHMPPDDRLSPMDISNIGSLWHQLDAAGYDHISYMGSMQHQLDAADYCISIGSLRQLDTAISAVPGPITGTIRAIVLPAVSLRDCRALREASETGFYHGIRFELPERDYVLAAKLGEQEALFDARVDVYAACLNLSDKLFNFSGGRVPQGSGRGACRTPQARARAEMGSQQWARDVDGPRQELDQIVASAREKLQAISTRLDAIAN